MSTKISICQVLCYLSRQRTEHFLCSITFWFTLKGVMLIVARGNPLYPADNLSCNHFFLVTLSFPSPRNGCLHSFEPHFFPNVGQSQLCSIFRNYFTPNYPFNYTVKKINHSLHFICCVWCSSNCLLWNYYFLFLLATI